MKNRFQALTRLLLGVVITHEALQDSVYGLKVTGIPQTCGQNLRRILEQPEQAQDYLEVRNGTSAFSDELFPAQQGSLFWESHHGGDAELLKTYADKVANWLRPYEVIHRYQKVNKDLPSLWGAEGIQPADPGSQGALHDGWFLGAAASLAEHPEYIMNIFTDGAYNQAGVFEINLFLDGRSTQIIIDDRLAMRTGDTALNAGPSQQMGWWLPLIEKAYAKVNVNYENLDVGRGLNQLEALRALSGMPVRRVDTQAPDLLEKLREYYLEGYALSVYIPAEYDLDNGLTRGRSYNLVDLIEVNDPHEALPQLVAIKLRDPWTQGGKVAYSGPAFSEFNLEPKDETEKTWYMSTDDFIRSFDYVTVAMLSDSWLISQKSFDKSTDDIYRMMITNNETQDVFITIDYPTQRMYAPGCPKQEIQYTAVLRQQGKDIIAQELVNTQIAYGFMEVSNLAPGDYDIDVRMEGNSNMATGFIVSLYTQESQVTFRDDYYVLSNSLRLAMERNDPKVMLSTAEDGQVEINAYNDGDREQITVEVVKNKTADYQVTIEVQTFGGFPEKTKSNTDWKNGLISQKATISEADETTEYYVMKVLCPQKEKRCIYVIPKASKLIGVLVADDVAI